MTHSLGRRTTAALLRRVAPLLLLGAFSFAQNPLDVKAPPTHDPLKGFADPSPLTAAEREMLRTQRPPHEPLPAGEPAHAAASTATGRRLLAALVDDVGDGLVRAIGNTWKATASADGFCYVPYFGSAAPRDFPVEFALRDVRVGGRSLTIAGTAPVRDGQRVQIARGQVVERYDLQPDGVEQTFVVDTELPGDVDVVIEVTSELVEDAAMPGIQFANELGAVHYGQAHVVRDGSPVPVSTTFAGRAITIHVPAAVRGSGPLVIDPLMTTQTVAYFGPGDQGQTDIAFDATSGRYLVVWQYQFSASDYDVYSEFCQANGVLLPATLGGVDISTLSHENPRVASLNSYDRFLIVMQRYENARWQVYGRLQLAGQFPHPILFPISDPSFAGNALNPDVGGDPAASGTADNWLVVWQRDLSATDSDILGRIVRADTALPGATLQLENSANTVYAMPAVSNSNGNGFATVARWMVVYQYRYSATDWDVYGCSLSQSGTITTSNTAIDTSTLNDLVPCVSSPNTDYAGGNPLFLVTYERQNPASARARLLSGGMVNQFPAADLGALGIGPFWVRPECDGNRFVVVNGATTINAATIAYDGTGLVVQDPNMFLLGIPAYPRICSQRSGGGGHTEYGIAYIDTFLSPDRVVVSTYEGRTPGNPLIPHGGGCQGLTMTGSGYPTLGDALTFQLTNPGTDIPAFLFGSSILPIYSICPACPVSVSPADLVLVVGATWSFTIPTNLSLVGFNAEVQGIAFGSGPCIATFRTSNSYEFTVQ